MAKIFMAFFNGNGKGDKTPIISCFHEGIIKGLESYGHTVVPCPLGNFGHDFKEGITESILSKIKNFNPDLMIFFNNHFYDVSEHFDCPILIYESDTALFYSNKIGLAKNPDRYKVIITQEASIKQLYDEFGISEDNIFMSRPISSIIAEEIPIRTNISFIGSKFDPLQPGNVYTVFMEENPTETEILQFKQAEALIKKHPFITKEELIDNLNITSKKVIEFMNPGFFINMISSINRIQTLSQIADLRLELYGTKNWITDLLYEPEVTMSYINKRVYSIQHNQDIYNSSKLSLNINHIQAVTGFSWRVCDIMASNACLVTEYKPDLKKYFPNIELPTFTNRFEAREQCIKLLNDEPRRRDIVLQCQDAIEKNHRFEHLLKVIEEASGLDLGYKSKEKVCA